MDGLSVNSKPQKRGLSQSNEADEGRVPKIMLRAPSSGIDLSAFSFARPANNRKSFTFRGPPKTSNLNTAFVGEATPTDTRREDGHERAIVEAEPRASTATVPEFNLLDARKSHPEPASLPFQHKQSSATCATILRNFDHEDAMATNRHQSQKPSFNNAQMNTEIRTRSDTAVEETPATSDVPVPRTESVGSPELGSCSLQIIESAVPESPRSSGPAITMDKLRVAKSRTRNRETGHGKRRLSMSSTQASFHQLNEEKLFELLIGRIRKREESEAVSVGVQRRMEAENSQLVAENQDLRHQVDTYYGLLQKTTAETKECKSRVEGWKIKIRKFKQVVDGLGQDYDALRDENTRAKEMAASLEREKCNLMDAIDAIKIQISRAEDRNEEQRSKISDHEKSIALLKQDLSQCEQRENTVRSQLSDEKKRCSNLEVYIQNQTKSHTRQLRTIRENQRRLAGDIDSGFAQIGKGATEFQDAIQSKLEMVSRGCGSAISSLAERITTATASTETFIETAHGIVADVTMLSGQFTEDIRSNARTTSDLLNAFRKDLKGIESQICADSTLLQQLQIWNASYDRLREKFQEVEPKLNEFNITAALLNSNHNTLVHDMTSLQEKLNEPQVPTSNPVLEMELSSKFSENTQLQLRIHDMSSEIDKLRKQLGEAQAKSQDLERSLSNSNSRLQAAEERNKSLEAEQKVLKSEVEFTAKRIRDETDQERSAAVERLVSQHKTDIEHIRQEKDEKEHASAEMLAQLSNNFESQIAGLKKQKDNIEHASAGRMAQLKAQYEIEIEHLQLQKNDSGHAVTELTSQLSGVQDCLAEAKKLIDKGRLERELLAQEHEQQINQLTKTCNEYSARLDSQVNEIQQYQAQEATFRLEATDLGEQLIDAQNKIHHLERQMTPGNTREDKKSSPLKNIVSFAQIERNLPPREDESPYNDAADFAMLLTSDECFPATPHQRGKAIIGLSQNSPKSTCKEQAERAGENTEDVFDQPQRAKPKRKEVNFEARQSKKKPKQQKGAETESIPPETISTQRDEGPVPNQVSKHVHKWTYSRIHSTSTEIQQEQTSMPVAERRASPKGLVSARNGSDARGRGNARSRSRRRSRGERYNARFSQGG
ncbi:hypothetical protein N7492_005937 [Penicillium capsulatum]|uniref:Uncharacterized protein n=1 Tax=Penicillium capsulatum TaxID=69766 RepID=A0A9W9ICB5_9EURO|nr:hypothetical protein N7492_005937 [Penicillium capsulatum]KAJ6134960.1 hypothetical protein N7512_000120 [Penicillium capsulatum]